MTRYELDCEDGPFVVDLIPDADGYTIKVEGDSYSLKLKRGASQNALVAEFADKPVGVTLLEADQQRVDMTIGGERLSFRRPAKHAAPPLSSVPVSPPLSKQEGLVVAPMPGKVIGALVKERDSVRAGDPLVMLESMKMEVAVRADKDGTVQEILVRDGTAVKRGQGLVRLG